MEACRRRWPRSRPLVRPTAAQIAAVVARAVPGATIKAAIPWPGGLANTTIRVTLVPPKSEGPEHTVCLRLWQRAPEQMATERALLDRLTTDRFPVPPILASGDRLDEEREGEGDKNDPVPWAVFPWVDGVPLDRAVPPLSDARRRQVGEAVGRTLARIHHVRFPRWGSLSPALTVPEPLALDGAGLAAFLEHCLGTGPGAERVGDQRRTFLRRLVERDGDALVAWASPPCLTHADFGGTNILVTPEHTIAAVLDWEFAFSGHPAFDLGNLMRPPLGDLPAFVEGVAAGYTAAGHRLPEWWQEIILFADLFAWTEFLARPDSPAVVIADALARLDLTLHRLMPDG